MKKKDGITMIALVVTVMIMLLISSVAINVSLEVYNQAKLQNFMSQLKVIQSKVDNLAESGEDVSSYGVPLRELPVESEAYQIFQKIITNPTQYNINMESWNEALDGTMQNYYYLNEENLKVLGLKNQTMSVVINFQTRNVIAQKSIKIEGKEYYRQYDLRDYGGDQLVSP